MTIYLGNPMVRSNAPAGTGSGTLSADEGQTQIPSGGIGGQYSAKGTGVDDLGFGDRAVRDDRQIALPGQNVGRAPVHLNDPAIGAAVDADPVARPVGAAEVQDDPREHITQRALQRQSKNNRDGTRSRKKALYRQIEDVSDDRENRGEVNKAGEQILDQLSRARTALGNDKRAQKADHEPRRPQPPSDL